MAILDRFVPPRRELLVFATAAGICLGFALYTDHRWEDYYITFRSSRNLAEGNGLVFTPGERVHSFTSPFNVLIPAGFSFITGNYSDRLVLWLFRCVSIVGTGFAATMLYGIARVRSLGSLAVLLLLGLFLTNPLIVDFTINGQETGLMMFFLALTLHALAVPSRNKWLRLGLAWAGLMWTRPDGCVYGFVIAAVFFAYNLGPGEVRTRANLFKTFVLAGSVAALLYLPWFVWAWWYFGSPVPHTVIAKGLGHPSPMAGVLNAPMFVVQALFGLDDQLGLPFLPNHANTFRWPMLLHKAAGILGWIAAFSWLLPFGRRETRAISLAFLLCSIYMYVIVPYPFPWYLPNLAILGVCAIAGTTQEVARLLDILKGSTASRRTLLRVRRVFAVGILSAPVVGASLLLCVAYQLRIQQREIEEGNRMQIGLWLRANAGSSHDSVFLEPLGYIGYYSQLKMLDWPGLCAPEVVAARKAGSVDSWAQVIGRLRPDWLVLRPYEAKSIDADDQALLHNKYLLVKVFDVSNRVDSYRWLPGRAYVMFDATFLIFHRAGSYAPSGTISAMP
jgi:hypothetical protein